jgi:hypothetical protein
MLVQVAGGRDSPSRRATRPTSPRGLNGFATNASAPASALARSVSGDVRGDFGLLEGPADRNPRLVGQLHIQQDEIRARFVGEREALGRVSPKEDLVAPEGSGQQRTDGGLVINDQDPEHASLFRPLQRRQVNAKRGGGASCRCTDSTCKGVLQIRHASFPEGWRGNRLGPTGPVPPQNGVPVGRIRGPAAEWLHHPLATAIAILRGQVGQKVAPVDQLVPGATSQVQAEMLTGQGERFDLLLRQRDSQRAQASCPTAHYRPEQVLPQAPPSRADLRQVRLVKAELELLPAPVLSAHGDLSGGKRDRHRGGPQASSHWPVTRSCSLSLISIWCPPLGHSPQPSAWLPKLPRVLAPECGLDHVGAFGLPGLQSLRGPAGGPGTLVVALGDAGPCVAVRIQQWCAVRVNRVARILPG